jgi:transcription elongation factor GreA
MDKSALRNYMIAHQNHIIEDLKKAVEELHKATDLDEGDTIDADDFSHQEETRNYLRLLEEQLNKAIMDREILEKLPTENVSTVQIGSFVETENIYFYVGVSTTPFELNGKNIIGISTTAPIYLSMKNKKKGDKFSSGKHEYKIKSIC